MIAMIPCFAHDGVGVGFEVGKAEQVLMNWRQRYLNEVR